MKIRKEKQKRWAIPSISLGDLDLSWEISFSFLLLVVTVRPSDGDSRYFGNIGNLVMSSEFEETTTATAVEFTIASNEIRGKKMKHHNCGCS